MIGANELLGVANATGHQSRATVAAGIEVTRKRAVGPADNEHRLATHMRGEVIAGIRDMGVVAEKDPVGLEDVAVFGLQNVRVIIDRAIDTEYAIRRTVINVIGKAAPIAEMRLQVHPTGSVDFHVRSLADLNPLAMLFGNVGGKLGG